MCRSSGACRSHDLGRLKGKSGELFCKSGAAPATVITKVRARYLPDQHTSCGAEGSYRMRSIPVTSAVTTGRASPAPRPECRIDGFDTKRGRDDSFTFSWQSLDSLNSESDTGAASILVCESESAAIFGYRRYHHTACHAVFWHYFSVHFIVGLGPNWFVLHHSAEHIV